MYQRKYYRNIKGLFVKFVALKVHKITIGHRTSFLEKSQRNGQNHIYVNHVTKSGISLLHQT